MKPFKRSEDHHWISGVCVGLAYSLGLSAKGLRFLWLVLFFCSFGVALLLYLFLWIIIPEWDEDPEDMKG